MEEVAYRLTDALLKVASNKGAPGPDGQTIEMLLEQWLVVLPRLQADLLAGTYQPGGIRRVFIPKAGGGQRGLGIPDVVDRVVQEAVRQVLTMGNIGHTQNLVHVTRAFESSAELAELGASFVLAGDGVAADDVRAAVGTDRVRVTGVLEREALDAYLRRAAVAVVSQQYDGVDFNVPSKLMNFMGYGLPTLAAVRSDSEVARIVADADGGWVTNGSDPRDFSVTLARALRDRCERDRRGERALEYAKANFAPGSVAEQFEGVLAALVGKHTPPFPSQSRESDNSRP
jgi:glycosyltransferase involved in cell wall biosynthesis